MRAVLLFMGLMAISPTIHAADVAAPVGVAPAAQAAPVVVPPASPAVTPVIVAPTAAPLPASAPLPAAVAKDAVAIQPPPTWLASVLQFIFNVPVVGPVAVVVAQWIGVIASMMTILVTALLAMARVLLTVSNIASLSSLAAKVEAFMNGPIVYWLKFFSMYNVPAVPPPAAAPSEQKPA